MQSDQLKKQFTTLVLPTIVCGLAAAFYLYDYFVQVSPAVITHELMGAFNIDARGLSFLGACFFYAYAGMQIPVGLLLNRFGARKLLSFAVLISGLGVIIFGLSHHVLTAGLARFLVGFGSAFSFISALYLSARWFKHQYFTLIAGLVQFAGCLGSIIGEAPLAHLINQVGWRETMLITGLFTIILSLLYWLIIRDNPSTKIVHEERSQSLLQEVNKFKQVVKIPQVWWVGLCGFFCWVPAGVIGALWGVPYFMKIYHWSNTQAAALCSIFWLSVGLSSPLLGWFSNRINRRRVPCYLAFACGLFGSILIIFAPELPLSITIIALVLLGICPAVQSLSFGIIKDFLPIALFGSVSGFNNMMPILAGAIAQQIVGFILVSTWGHTMLNGIPIYSLHSYQIAFITIAIGMLLGLLISSFKVVETYCKQTQQ